MIELKGIHKSFMNSKNETVVLKNMNLQIYGSDFITIMGPSGGGKSTLLYTIGLLSEPTSGDIFFNGQQVIYKNEEALDDLRRTHIGLVFQNSNLISCLTPKENILIAMKGNESLKYKSQKVEHLLDKVGLWNKRDETVGTLSGGEAQRVAIVRALVNEPSVLLCDEPTGALDSANGEKVMELLLEVKRENKCALVLVTHDKRTGELGNRRIWLKDGVLDENAHSIQAL